MSPSTSPTDTEQGDISTLKLRRTNMFRKGKLLKLGKALPLSQWHRRLGHLNYAAIKQLASNHSHIKLANSKEPFCEPCTYGKQHAIINHQPQPRADGPFDLIHIDLGGGRSTLPNAETRMLILDEDIPPTAKGCKYFMIITDDYTRYRWFYPMAHKSDAKNHLFDWSKKISTQFEKTPKRIRTDFGREWLND